jgi:hypothetical protein
MCIEEQTTMSLYKARRSYEDNTCYNNHVNITGNRSALPDVFIALTFGMYTLRWY